MNGGVQFLFEVVAVSPQGSLLTERLRASDAAKASEQLQLRGLRVLSCAGGRRWAVASVRVFAWLGRGARGGARWGRGRGTRGSARLRRGAGGGRAGPAPLVLFGGATAA